MATPTRSPTWGPRAATAPALQLTAWLTLAAVAGCGSPCRALSERVCRCEPTAAARATCLTRVASLAAAPSEASVAAERAAEARCGALLGGCSCDRLAAGDLAACGLGAP